MLQIGLYILLLGCGIGLMIWGADTLITIAQYISGKFKFSPMVTGAVLLGFGTSLPEIVISINASIKGTPMIAYGNVLGSNIANIGLIMGLGLAVSSAPLILLAKETRHQFLLLGISVLAFMLFVYDFVLTPMEAWISLALFITCLVIILKSRVNFDAQEKIKDIQPIRLILLLGGGLAAVGYGGELTVNNAQDLAIALGVPVQVVGLVLVAVGTSLPELVVTIRLSMKGQPKMIVANIVGSNIFNLLLVLPIVYLVTPLQLEQEELYRDGGFMILLTLLLLVLGFSWRNQREVPAKGGIVLLFIYSFYICLLAYQILA